MTNKTTCRMCGKVRKAYDDGLCFFCFRKTHGLNRTCATCGSIFKSKSSRNRYCDSCKARKRKNAEHLMSEKKVCPKCHKSRSVSKFTVDDVCCYCHQQESRELRSLKDFGVRNYMSTDEFKEKAKKTNLAVYGCTHPQSNLKVREKISVHRSALMRMKAGWNEEAQKFMDDSDYCKSVIESFDHKPKYNEIEDRLDCHSQYIAKAIRAFGFHSMIDTSVQHSEGENEVRSFVESLGFTTECNRTILDNREIDVYIPSKRIGIEYDGSYWHQEKFAGKDGCLSKTIECEKNGIRLIHVSDWEWLERRKQVEGIIRTALGLNDRIFARKCDLVDVSSQEAMAFLEENHLQGYVPSTYRIGLSYDDELVAVMTFGKNRFRKDGGIEMLRFACKDGIDIVGGESRLLKHSIEKFGFTKILSYCNRSKFTGNGYERIGFRHVRDTVPGYVWADHGSHVSRYKSQMKDEVRTMESKGWYRVFDCGNKVYEYDVS